MNTRGAVIILSILGLLMLHLNSTLLLNTSDGVFSGSLDENENGDGPTIGGKVCIVIRTSIREEKGHYGLPMLMETLESLNNENWEALLFTLDDVPFPNLPNLVAGRDLHFRHKYRVLDALRPPDLVRPYDPQVTGYPLTDWAITQCSADSKWLVVTQGDNWYRPEFLDSCTEENERTKDVIGVNFYSRYSKRYKRQNKNNPPKYTDKCSVEAQYCMKQEFRLEYSDLGSVMWNMEFFTRHNLRYGAFPPSVGSSQDGELINLAVSLGARTLHVDECLYSHNPNRWADCMWKYNQRGKFKRLNLRSVSKA